MKCDHTRVSVIPLVRDSKEQRYAIICDVCLKHVKVEVSADDWRHELDDRADTEPGDDGEP